MGEKGGDARNETQPRNENENENESTNETKTKPKRQKRQAFTPPTLEEVKAYHSEKGFDCDPEQFYNHFEANGWLVGGKTPMKKWQPALCNWEKNDRKFANNRPTPPKNTPPTSSAGVYNVGMSLNDPRLPPPKKRMNQ